MKSTPTQKSFNNFECSYYEKNTCRSCSLLPLGLEKSLDKKIMEAKTILSSVVPVDIISSSITVKTPLASRNKAKMIAAGTYQYPILGIVDSAMHINELTNCPLHKNILNKIIKEIYRLISKYKINPYDMISKIGELKGVILSCNSNETQCCVRFVLKSIKNQTSIKELFDELINKFPQIKVTSINIQPIAHAILEGPEEIILSETKYLEETFGDIHLYFTPQSFMQVTAEIAKVLYQTGAKWIADKLSHLDSPTCLDLYCGVGGFAIHIAKLGIQTQGYEINSSSIQAAKYGASKNNLQNLVFETLDIDSNLNISSKYDSIIVNPPRRGLSNNVIDFIINNDYKTCLYSSCNPKSLSSNLERLSDKFSVTKIQFFDMFPLTEHLETLVLLETK